MLFMLDRRLKIYTFNESNDLLTNQLNPWRQNTEVHHRVQNRLSTIPIRSQLGTFYTPVTLPDIHYELILSSMPRFS
jgi:hypothetical protein